MKTIQKWAVIAIVLFSFAQNASAQRVFTAAEMAKISPSSLDKAAVLHFMKMNFSVDDPFYYKKDKGLESTEARVAATLIKVLTSAQMQSLKATLENQNQKGAGGDKNKTTGGASLTITFDATDCDVLNYGDFWYSMGLCHK